MVVGVRVERFAGRQMKLGIVTVGIIRVLCERVTRQTGESQHAQGNRDENFPLHGNAPQ